MQCLTCLLHPPATSAGSPANQKPMLALVSSRKFALASYLLELSDREHELRRLCSVPGQQQVLLRQASCPAVDNGPWFVQKACPAKPHTVVMFKQEAIS